MDDEDDQGLEPELRAAVAGVWARRKGLVLARTVVLSETVALLSAGQASPEKIDNARTEAHRLAGALGSFGFEKASRLAASIEKQLDAPPFSEASIATLKARIGKLRNDLQER